MTLTELQKLFWRMSTAATAGIITNPDKFIRWRYPAEGAPDWRISDNILFLFLLEANDPYAQQRDSQYVSQNGTVYRKTARTRVWDLQCIAYGPRAYDVVTALKDGTFYESVKKLLGDSDVYLVPDLPAAMHAPELFAGQWWERWDITLRFNELYQITPEDVGHIDSVSVITRYNRP